MKIICVGRNYTEHIKELKNEEAAEPVIFLKPDSALLRNNKDFYIPDFSNNVQHEIEVVVRINRLGKHIQEKFAHRYYKEITVGIDFTARDLQNKLREKGLPWEKSKAFDFSAAIGDFISVESTTEVNNIEFHLKKNQKIAQQGNTGQMLYSIDKLIAYISKYFTLKIGDLIFTGTPAGVSKVDEGDYLEGYISDKKLLDIRIK